MIPFEDFKKIEIVIAIIKEVEVHPDADKLYVCKVDIGGQERQLVAGIRLSYQKEELLGRRVAVVTNLQPAVIRGVESQGMILAASDSDGMSVMSPDRDVACGSRVR